MEFTAAQVARTGKDERWGTVLYLVARGFGCRSGLELGTCAGISAMYVAPILQRLVTVEGSADLCTIARVTLADFPQVRVVNALFDDALDREPIADLDYAFIDGHHEKVATIHYTERILPKMAHEGVMVFDDISWSADMREAWDTLRIRDQWSDAIDLGAMGICVVGSGGRQWDMQPVVGRPRIGSPWGWRQGAATASR